jgi:phosphoribosylaminoimidazole-succinocarboxamide synthase
MGVRTVNPERVGVRGSTTQVGTTGQQHELRPDRVFTTKALYLLEPPTAARPGRGRFEFLDSYSVFHYGRMPDAIPGKGEATCAMAEHSLEMLQEAGMPTHLRERVDARTLEVDIYRVPETPVPAGTTSVFVPLQVIFRNSLPPGASIFRRVARGQVTLADLGLDELPSPGEALATPIVEFTTKIEPVDRFVSEREAAHLAGLDGGALAGMKAFALEVDAHVTRHAAARGLEHADGKVEFALDARGDLVLVDIAGTPDENRFVRHGLALGKQVLRDHYERAGFEERYSAWLAGERAEADRPEPDPLPGDLVDVAARIYGGLSDLWIRGGGDAEARLDGAIAEARGHLRADPERDRA